MKYGEFEDWVQKNCRYETFYVDSEGRSILVIRQLDAWGMCNKFPQPKQWVGFTDKEIDMWTDDKIDTWNIFGYESLPEFVRAIEAKLKEKNF